MIPRFNLREDIEFTPDEWEKFEEGAQARKGGKKLSDCPYDDDFHLEMAWHAGWADQDMLEMDDE